MWALLEGGWWETTSGRRWHLSRASRDPHSSVGKESASNAEDPHSIPGSGRSPGEGISYPLQYSWASPVAQLVKNLPAVQETWAWSLGWEDPLEKGKATHPVFWPGESHRLYGPWRLKESDTPERLTWETSGMSQPGRGWGGRCAAGERRRRRKTHAVCGDRWTDGQTELTVVWWRGWDDLGDQKEAFQKSFSLCANHRSSWIAKLFVSV